tara:strand:+ start:94 stop:237 length:144 start_codon:yes stop_codon:yes gene_type:complete
LRGARRITKRGVCGGLFLVNSEKELLNPAIFKKIEINYEVVVSLIYE